jgi:hypothetical protein
MLVCFVLGVGKVYVRHDGRSGTCSSHNHEVVSGRVVTAWALAIMVESNEIGKDSSSLNESCCNVSHKCMSIDLIVTYYSANYKAAEQELYPCLATQDS